MKLTVAFWACITNSTIYIASGKHFDWALIWLLLGITFLTLSITYKNNCNNGGNENE